MERTTVGSILRSTQAYCLQLSQKETLDFGIAYYSTQFPALPEANQFREVIAEGSDLHIAFEQSEKFFASRNLTCRRWAAAEGTSSSRLGEALEPHGFREVESLALHLSAWPEAVKRGSHATEPGVRILPARAMRTALQATFTDPVEAQAMLERMDDPQLDMFVAIVDGKPAGRCGLHQVGDVARVLGPVEVSGFERRHVSQALLISVLAMARRLAFANVCAQVRRDEASLLELMLAHGFIEDGEIIEFHRLGPNP